MTARIATLLTLKIDAIVGDPSVFGMCPPDVLGWALKAEAIIQFAAQAI
jgi:hypothetical protein